ncbi:MAG TPA: hypothetical protein VMU14_08245 [Acidimicrobiales bacterium]|nr:hypothetical protein [Acidimicrobiales bacterium]
MSDTMSYAVEIDHDLVEQAHVLRQRAESLRHQALSLTLPLASAYRRRASELEFEAWVSELQAGLPYDEVQPAA